jgi:propionyl-CoA carboxylase alpha chain
MLAKLIAWAPTRAEAAGLLAASLRSARVDGLVTNRDFLVNVLAHEAFLAGETDTGFLERHDGLAEPLVSGEEARLALVAAALCSRDAAGPSPLAFVPAGWRNNPAVGTRRDYETAAGAVAVHYRLGRGGRDAEVSIDGEDLGAIAVEGEPAIAPPGGDGSIELLTGGVRRLFRVRRRDGVAYVSGPSGTVALAELPRYPEEEGAATEGALVAPMPGKVIRLAAAEGDEVAQGDVIAVLEAMKMEHELTAPADGTLADVRVGEGDQVESGALIGVIAAAGADS